MARAGPALGFVLALLLLGCEKDRAQEQEAVSHSQGRLAHGSPALSSSARPPADPLRVGFHECFACSCCDSGRFAKTTASCADCGLNNVLRAHGISYVGSGRLQIDPSGPSFRLSSYAPVRLKLPEGTTELSLTIAQPLREPPCELRLSSSADGYVPQSMPSPIYEGDNSATMTRAGGAPLGVVELNLQCNRKVQEVTIRELWLLPPPTRRWPELAMTSAVTFEAIPAPTRIVDQSLFWDPPVTLQHDFGEDSAKVALAILATSGIKNRLALGDLDSFQAENTVHHEVTLSRKYLWKGERLPVLDTRVRVALLDGHHLDSIHPTLGPPITIPSRTPISERAALAALKLNDPHSTRDILGGLVIRDGRLSFETNERCQKRYVDGFTGKVTKGLHRCIQ